MIDNLREYRDTRDEKKKRRKYGGTVFIVDKLGNNIWRINASLLYIEDQISTYKRLKNSDFDNKIATFRHEINLNDFQFEFVQFCIDCAYTKSFIDEFKLICKDILLKRNKLEEKTVNLIKNFVENETNYHRPSKEIPSFLKEKQSKKKMNFLIRFLFKQH